MPVEYLIKYKLGVLVHHIHWQRYCTAGCDHHYPTRKAGPLWVQCTECRGSKLFLENKRSAMLVQLYGIVNQPASV